MTILEVSKMSRAGPGAALGFEQDLAAGTELLDHDRRIDAFDHFARMAAAHPRSEAVLQGASRAWLAMARSADAADRSAAAARDLRFLIEEPSTPFDAPTFHRAIAALCSGGLGDHLRSVADALSAPLRRAIDDPAAGKGMVLLLLIVRQWAGPWLDQERVTALHRQWLPAFEYGDLKLIYNTMFPPTGCERNAADLAAFGRSDARLRAGAPPFHAFNSLLLDWISPGTDAAGGVSVQGRLEALQAQPDPNPAQRAGLRSWLVREWTAAARPQADRAGTDLAPLLDAAAARRQALLDASHRLDAPSLIDGRAWQGAQYLRERLALRAPWVRKLRRKPRVAVCVSGQLRGYRAALRSWREVLLPAWDADIFVHSWTRIGRSSAEPFRTVLPFQAPEFCKAYVEVCAQLGFDRIKLRYPTLFSQLAAGSVVGTDDVSRAYGTPHVQLDDDTAEPFASMSNQQKMHMKIEACFDSALASGNEYELFVRLRPDKPVSAVAVDWTAMARRCDASAVLFADHAFGVHYGAPMIGDQMAVASRGVMEIYARTWSLYPPLAQAGLLGCLPYFEGHHSLAMVSWFHGIHVRKVPVRFGPLQEAERMPAAEVLEQVRRDAQGRGDAIDKRLLEALQADTAS